MIGLSDSESSAPSYSSPEDDDYNTSDNNSDDDRESEDETAKAVPARHGFHSMNSNAHRSNSRSRSPNTPEGKEPHQWLSTQPASQSQSSLVVVASSSSSSSSLSLSLSEKRRRISPRRNANARNANPNAMDHNTPVIPKKQEFQRHPQEAAERTPTTPATTPTPTTRHLTDNKQEQEQKQKQLKQPPMKKRKVSLSPTDSLARQQQPQQSQQPPQQQLTATATTPPLSTKVVAPSLLAAANKQQKEHIEASKQKLKQKQQKSNTTTNNTNKYSSNASHETHTKKNPKRLSTKVSRVSYAAAEYDDDDSTRLTKPPAKKRTHTTTIEAAATAASKSNESESVVKGNQPTRAATTPMQSHATQNKVTKHNATSSATATAKAKPMLPPKKKKKKRITFEHELLQKMFMACRPYSTRELVQLMGKTTSSSSEASINFCLLSLLDKQWVLKKEFRSGNRTKELYWANQESRDKKLWALECLQLPSTEAIRGARFELATLLQQHKSRIREVESLEKTPSNEHLSTKCHTVQQEADDLSAKLERMKGRILASSTVSAIRPIKGATKGGTATRKSTATKTPLQLKKRINVMRDHWIKRKRKCMDFVDSLADGMEKKTSDVVHKVLELETDEAEHAILPQKHVI